jgi:hypothetical protein
VVNINKEMGRIRNLKMQKNSDRNIEVIKKKLQDAVSLAKTTLEPPDLIIRIQGESCIYHITVERVNIDGKEFLCIFGSGNNEKKTLFKSPKDKFRAIVFESLSDCKIIVLEKILKLTFLDCINCKISIRGGSIGPVEFISCDSLKIDVRGDLLTGSSIPVVQIDMSKDIHFYQRTEELVYAVCGCRGITGVIIDSLSKQKIKETPMETSIFREQTFFLFSKKEGIVQIQERYALNNIVQHLVFHENSESENPNDETFASEDRRDFSFSPVE